LAVSRPLPVYPDQQTFVEFVGMSLRCHHRKSVDLSIASSALSNQQSIPASAVLVYDTDRDTIWRLLLD
jgi:hypothetical protein